MKIFVGSSDRWQGQSLWQAILSLAKKEGLAGASISQGTAGFGASARLHTASLVDLAHDLPVKIEIVDVEERIKPFLQMLDGMLEEALIVIEDCHVIRYVRGG
jgi:hypothetical protein